LNRHIGCIEIALLEIQYSWDYIEPTHWMYWNFEEDGLVTVFDHNRKYYL